MCLVSGIPVTSRRRMGCLVLTTVLLMLGATGVGAQDPHRVVHGTVADTSGTPLSGVQVWIEGTRIGAITDSLGHYVLSGAAAGERTLVVEAIGHLQVRDTVVLPDSGEVVRDVVLKLDPGIHTGVWLGCDAKVRSEGAVRCIVPERVDGPEFWIEAFGAGVLRSRSEWQAFAQAYAREHQRPPDPQVDWTSQVLAVVSGGVYCGSAKRYANRVEMFADSMIVWLGADEAATIYEVHVPICARAPHVELAVLPRTGKPIHFRAVPGSGYRAFPNRDWLRKTK